MFESLGNQTFKDFDVIVVDQNTDDRLQPYLERAKELNLDIKHVRHSPPSLSGARNKGLELATGEWVGFPDDDCWYEADLLENLKKRFVCTDPLSGAAVQWAEEGIPSNLAPHLTWEKSRFFRDMPVASFQLFFHRKLFEKIGNFDCELGVGLWFGAAEETDLVMRALRAGALITFEPAARVHHPVKIPAPTPEARLAQRYRERGSGALYAKHRLPLWVIVRGLIAPVLRPLAKGKLGHDLALGWSVMMGRVDGLLRWNRRHQ
jgi:glycosyltransferase involved in cell wall biosynthesis